MTKITIDRATVEQALEAFRMCVPMDGRHAEVDAAFRNLRAALAEPVQEPDYWQEEARRYAGNADYWRKRYEALAEPESCQYPDCVDNGPEGTCMRWLLAECSKSEDYKPQRPAEPVQEPDNGGKTGWPPGLLQDDCRGLSKWLASRPDARQRLREALAEPVQEPEGYFSVNDYGRWEENKSGHGTPLYTAPPQRKPLSDEELDRLWRKPMSADWEHREYARAVERSHGIKEEK